MSKRAYERRIQKKRQHEKQERRRHRRNRLFKIYGSAGAVIAVAIVLLLLSPWSGGKPTASKSPSPTPSPGACTTPGPQTQGKKSFATPPCMTIDPAKSYTATIKTSLGSIKLALSAKSAPKTVNNFVFLARSGFYEGVIFHRVIPGFMIQGGDPQGTGSGGPGYQFEDEIDPTLVFDKKGVLAMANSGPATNGSQFFITVAPTTHLNGKHTIFGRVVSGMNVVEKIVLVPTTSDRPKTPVIITSVTITEK